MASNFFSYGCRIPNFTTPLQTFRPKKKFEPGTLKYSLHKQAQASLNSGINLRNVVALPPGEDLNDWIAVHGNVKYFSIIYQPCNYQE